ncbi:kinesin-like nuclear fusion protein, partial [Rhizophlyctis rosea]
MSQAAAVAEAKTQPAEETEFKVHTTGLKRKDAPAPSVTARNTRARLDTTSAPSKPTNTTTRTTTARGAATTRTATAAASRTTRSVTSKTTGARSGVGARTTAGAGAKSAVAARAGSPADNGGGDDSKPAKKKRPAWDVKGRLQDLEESHQQTETHLNDSKKQLTTMTDELHRSQATIDELIQFRRGLESTVQVKEKENHEISRELTDLRDQLRSAQSKHESELESIQSKHRIESNEMKATIDSLTREKDNLTLEVRLGKEENMTLRSTISNLSAERVGVESELRGVKSKLEQTEQTLTTREERIVSLEKQLQDAKNLVQELEVKVREEESIRRKLHNTIQELKGNIRVFCRVRPPLPAENEHGEGVLGHIQFKNGEEGAIELSQSVESASGSKAVTKSYPFQFDKVFTPQATQSLVFEEISQLVQSALDGYNVCIFAYGQTGSGKTYTMEGPPNALTSSDTAQLGMIPRTVQQIFETAEQLKAKGWKYEMEGQFLEIYNESIRDLLSEEKEAKAEWGGGKHGAGGDAGKKYEIRHLPGGKTVVEGAVVAPVTSPTTLHTLLTRATNHRSTAATLANDRSSRSHSIFSLRLSGTNSLTGESSFGVLNLIDLAGSERLKESGSARDGERLKETQAINKSLSALGDVIERLGE